LGRRPAFGRVALEFGVTHPPRIVLSRFDQERLEKLLASVGARPGLDALRAEIDRAEVVEPEEIPPNRVTMNSRVRFADEKSKDEHEITLVFPGHANVEENRISVLAPVGSALLGLSVGDTIEWPLPNARSRRLRVEAVTYQPEASGDRL
jgi:regulator of nucleoside diphosphate kinase